MPKAAVQRSGTDDSPRIRAASVLGRLIAAPLARHGTWDIRDPHDVLGRVQRGERFLFAVWHAEALPLIAFFYRYFILPGRRVTTLVSASGDGRLIARVIEDLGGNIAAGSSSRGALSGMREMIRAVRDSGNNAAITVDGPKGPRHVVKDGIVGLARFTGAPIVPLSAGIRAGVCFNSWDRFLLPVWCNRVRVEFGAPRTVARRASPGQIENTRGLLERDLLAMSDSHESMRRLVWRLGGRKRR